MDKVSLNKKRGEVLHRRPSWKREDRSQGRRHGRGWEWLLSVRQENPCWLSEFLSSLNNVDNNSYGSAEEQRNIETAEQYAARHHGEIRDDTITRFDHESEPFAEIDVYSMTPEELSKYLFDIYNSQALW